MKLPPVFYAVLFIVGVSSLSAQTPAPPKGDAAAAPAGNEEVRKVMETFKGRGVMRDNTPPTPPNEALKTFQMRDGLTIDMMASEPETCQPLYMSWDSRGRLWVMQYLQYPFPEGLKILSYDQHLRANFDKVPEPPPRGMKGADQVTVFEDTKGTGTFDKHKVVLSGLNIATAAIKGAGGIWVMNAPYLLFYPDANDDDIPDGDPQVMLSGFGLDYRTPVHTAQLGTGRLALRREWQHDDGQHFLSRHEECPYSRTAHLAGYSPEDEGVRDLYAKAAATRLGARVRCEGPHL